MKMGFFLDAIILELKKLKAEKTKITNLMWRPIELA